MSSRSMASLSLSLSPDAADAADAADAGLALGRISRRLAAARDTEHRK